jgi:hypothetical protein
LDNDDAALAAPDGSAKSTDSILELELHEDFTALAEASHAKSVDIASMVAAFAKGLESSAPSAKSVKSWLPHTSSEHEHFGITLKSAKAAPKLGALLMDIDGKATGEAAGIAWKGAKVASVPDESPVSVPRDATKPGLEGMLKTGLLIKIKYLPNGSVVQTPDGKMVVLKKDETAQSGYVSAYDLETGEKVELPESKTPHKAATKPAAKELAARKLRAVGPPEVFQGVASWHAAQTHVPRANEIGLTSEEEMALTAYTTSQYLAINAALRDSSSVKNLKLAKTASAISRALRKGAVAEDVWIGRRTNNDKWKAKAKAGYAIHDNGVISTSYSPGTWSGNLQLNILVRKGSNALNVSSISTHPHEHEILLAPGSHFLVHKREDKGEVTVLWLELL